MVWSFTDALVLPDPFLAPGKQEASFGGRDRLVLSWSKTRWKKANTPLPISSLSRDVAETELKSASLTNVMAFGFSRRKIATLLTVL